MSTCLSISCHKNGKTKIILKKSPCRIYHMVQSDPVDCLMRAAPVSDEEFMGDE
jgi:hypothetical protein